MSLESLLSPIQDPKHLALARDFLRFCPPEILSAMRTKTFRPQEPLIEALSPSDTVYLLLKGRLQVIEERVGEVPYHFSELTPLDIAGDYEVFAEKPYHFASVTAVESSLCLLLPSRLYLRWMKTDSHALFLRTQMLMGQLSGQSQFERQFLFWDTKTKLMFLIFQECQKFPVAPSYRLPLTRTEMAGKMGCSVRTLNRAILALKEEGLLLVSRGKLLVEQKQLVHYRERLKQVTELPVSSF